MLNCYCCGKIILSKKVLGQVGSGVYYFCSEKCRSITWNKIGVKDPDSLETSSSGISDSSSGGRLQKKVHAKNGSPSVVEIDGAEYSYSAKTDRISMKLRLLSNKSGGTTGMLRIELFLSKSGVYRRGEAVSGTTVAVSSEYEPLKKNYNYTNITSTVLAKNAPKPGTYQPVLFVKELNEDGVWHVAGFVNFPNTQRWN